MFYWQLSFLNNAPRLVTQYTYWRVWQISLTLTLTLTLTVTDLTLTVKDIQIRDPKTPPPSVTAFF